MPETLRDQLADARHDRFVGREPELGAFARALSPDPPAVHVVHLHGPGGVGKTALLDEVARLAHSTGAAVARLDARDLTPAPDDVAEAARVALEGAAPTGPDEDGARRVLLIDTYERVASLDEWVRRTFVPGLRATDLVVLAGRERPAPEWRSEWAGRVVAIPLRNLSPDAASAFLSARGVPEPAHDAVLGFTHGHPLALALAAEWIGQRDGSEFDPAEAPALLADLLARFAADVQTPSHRAALEATSVVRSVTVPLLAALLPQDRGDGLPSLAFSAEELFAWLRGLAFVEADARGLRLHDVVRETVEADLRWRDPEHHAAFHKRARRFYADRMRAPLSEGHRRDALSDFLHLYRLHPVARPLLAQLRTAWVEAELSGAGSLREGEAAAVREMVERHGDSVEADRVAGWLERRPDSVEVFRGAGGDVVGALVTLHIEGFTPEDRDADPVAAAVWDHLGSRLRENERGLLFRTWVDAGAGQGVSAVQSLIFARTVERYLTTPGLAASVLLTSAPDLWTPVFSLAGLQRWADAEADGLDTPLAAFGVDWRATPPDAWLDGLAARAPSDDPPEEPDEPLVVLSEEAFAESVREALKAAVRPHQLLKSPLLHSRLVRERDGEPVEALAALLLEAAQQLEAGVRERPYFRALDLTYFRPAPTQAIAAERLDLPFSTYRRHLRRGIDHVVGVLWRAEVGQ